MKTTALKRETDRLNKWCDKQLKLKKIDMQREAQASRKGAMGRWYISKRSRVGSPWTTYFIQGKVTGFIKIGKAKDVHERIKALQTGSPDILEILGSCSGDGEKTLHKLFASIRMHGEWFRPEPELLEFIKEIS